MDRGPMALFGAIVAVGLGPALWLGAQFGRFDVAPPGPPVPVDRTHDATTQLMGGTAGGEDETGDDNTPVGVTPRTHLRPAKATPSATPSSSPTDTTPSASPSVSDSPSPSTGPSDSSDPPSDGDGSGNGGDDSTPPSPPADDGGGGGSGGTGDGTGAGDGSLNAETGSQIQN
jgi:hypothetical protein